MELEPLCLTLSVRRLVEFLLKTGSIDNRFTGFDRANEGARLHRQLQKQAVKDHPDYTAEVSLKEEYTTAGICYCIEGRADGIYTAEDGVTVVEEIKTTAAPSESITPAFAPEHWAQGEIYAAIYARQHGLSAMRVQLTYYQVDEEATLRFTKDHTANELDALVQKLLTEYAPWARRAQQHSAARSASLAALRFPFAEYRPGQRAMAGAVFGVCQSGGALLCQAPTGIGKTMSVLFPSLKSMGDGVDGPVFYLTARNTTHIAAQSALTVLRKAAPDLILRSIALTAKDKICLCETRECSPDACPYADGYYSRIKDALADALQNVPALDAAALTALAKKHTVCPFELGLDLSLWCDVIVADYNYLFDPVVSLRRFFETKGDFIFLVDEAHNLPGRAREMHSASLCKSAFYDAKKRLGKGKSGLKTALSKVNEQFIQWRHECGDTAESTGGKTLFSTELPEAFDRQLSRLSERLEQWLDEHRSPDETHAALLQLYFDIRTWLRTAESYDDHFVFQRSCYGSEVRAALLCLDPSAFLAADFAKGRAAVLFSATLSPAGYYKDLCGLPDARAVALKSPFPPENLGLWCAGNVSTRYRDRDASVQTVAGYLAAMASAKPGNYIAFFPSYAYLEQVYGAVAALAPSLALLKQEAHMDEAARAAFLGRFAPEPTAPVLGFAVLGGVFGEGVDLTGDRLIGVAIVGPGLPQVNPRTEQLREHFEATRGSGFDYAYRYPGMNKVLQAAGRVIRTPEDKGVVLLIDDRFTTPAYRRLMPPHWERFSVVQNKTALSRALEAFWAAK